MNDLIQKEAFLSGFERHFGAPERLYRAPARTNIIGEHCDYNDGLVMPVNMALYTWLATKPRDDRMVRIIASGFDTPAEFDLDALHPEPGGGWAEYPKGVMQVLEANGFALRGADILLATDIPIGGGLSSSASLETVVGMAMLDGAGHAIDRSKLAWMCKAAENEFVGVSCGIMDQYVIALSAKGQAMMLDCRSMRFLQVLVPEDVRLLVVHSGVRHALNDGGFNQRQEECQQVVSILQKENPATRALRDVTAEQLELNREKLGETLFRRARHVVNEIQRVRDAHGAMASGDPQRLGNLLNDSHESLRDDFEVSCAELDDLVTIARNCDGVLGSRMVGAGFGGCTVSLVEAERVDQVQREVCEEYGRKLGRPPWACVVESADPVTEVAI
jgi:galactokinase